MATPLTLDAQASKAVRALTPTLECGGPVPGGIDPSSGLGSKTLVDYGKNVAGHEEL